MKRTWQVLMAGALIVLTSCSGSDGPLADLGEAACEDLRNGMSFFQLAQSGLEQGLSRKEIASALTLGVEDHCPEFRDEYRRTMIYTEWQ